jgi:hypothetical protein
MMVAAEGTHYLKGRLALAICHSLQTVLLCFDGGCGGVVLSSLEQPQQSRCIFRTGLHARASGGKNKTKNQPRAWRPVRRLFFYPRKLSICNHSIKIHAIECDRRRIHAVNTTLMCKRLCKMVIWKPSFPKFVLTNS